MSALTMAEGMRSVAGGDPVLIDTEGGRSKKYADLFGFQRRSDKLGEDFIIKLPAFFRPFFSEGERITKETGRALAAWAKGSELPANLPKVEKSDQAANLPLEDETVRLMRDQLKAAAAQGTEALRAAWRTVPPELKAELTATKEALKAVAAAADAP
jgi:hypothetical protein